jgi:hypothetical protein
VDLADGVGERSDRDVVAFVRDDQTVAAGELSDICSAREGLHRYGRHLAHRTARRGQRSWITSFFKRSSSTVIEIIFG